MIYRILIVLGLVLLLLSSCRRDDYFEGPVEIGFSVDTLRFDTVFTTIGSVTRAVKLYNPENRPVLVDIELDQSFPQYFRINADGLPGPVIRNVEINGRDSIYIFVETTIDPDQPLSLSPFIIESFVQVSVNGNSKKLFLEAFGQNANYITPSSGKGQSFLLSCDLGQVTWNDPKPYVIYGRLFIDSCDVVIPAGTRIHVHGGIVRDSTAIFNDGAIIVFKNGSLDCRGTVDNPVVFEGDRLEPEFRDNNSQWLGIIVWQESRKNSLNHTIIKNSIVGLRLDSLAKVDMSSCQISNTGSAAVIARHAEIRADNCLFFGNASYGIQLAYGGQYSFDYCTVASYTGQREAIYMDDVQCEDPFCSERRLNALNASFRNCIFTGSDKDEVGLVNLGAPENFTYSFSHCAVKVDELLDADNFPDFFSSCTECIPLQSSDLLFLNRRDNDYRLDTMSVVLGKALPISDLPLDITGKPRKTVPDIGCFEF